MLVFVLGLSSNISLYNLLARKAVIPCWVPTLVMFFDVALMTILFFQVVSIYNPLSILYIIYIVLGALLLERKCSYSLTAFTFLCYGIFFCFASPSPIDHSILNATNPVIGSPEALTIFSRQIDEYFKSYSYFMFFIFFLVALLIVYPVAQIKKNMEEQDEIFKELEEERMRNEKLASLATFAAGAAHEFSTPLSTIAIAAGEMLFYFKKQGGDKALIDDTRLIRDQVARCKEILYQMSADCGKLLGEAVDKFSLKELVYEVMSLFNFENMQHVNFNNRVGDMHIVMPIRTLTRTIKELMKNAMDASDPGSPIELTCWNDSQYLYFEVLDQGAGMDETAIKRAIEPFYTSKQPGKGMGLGLYLAKVMANRFGGDLKLTSRPGEGTSATLSFALNRIQADNGADA